MSSDSELSAFSESSNHNEFSGVKKSPIFFFKHGSDFGTVSLKCSTFKISKN